jgi:hypothetical protein
LHFRKFIRARPAPMRDRSEPADNKASSRLLLDVWSYGEGLSPDCSAHVDPSAMACRANRG